jgi:GDPmannose 4,6-dehydratase
LAASELGISLKWKGAGLEEKGFNSQGDCIVSLDPRYLRAAEVPSLLGDATKARTKLGWKPRVTFSQLVREMVAADLVLAEREKLVKASGYRIFEYHE